LFSTFTLGNLGESATECYQQPQTNPSFSIYCDFGYIKELSTLALIQPNEDTCEANLNNLQPVCDIASSPEVVTSFDN
jgi:hypothetical protein